MPERSRRLLALALAAGLARPALPALAQVGLGAERYEVTITPPKRPGTEAPVDAEAGAAPAATPPASAEPGAAASPEGAAALTAPAAPSSAPAAVAVPSATDPAAARAAANLPLKTLQVGAFRQKKSAGELREALSSNFLDVSVVEVQSGGEPLFRVVVGRLPRGPALDDLKRRLTAAGHPAFEVPAPPVSASR